MTYEYIDDFDQPLTIKTYEWADNSETVMLTIPSGQSNIIPEDAPAIALAILEAARYDSPTDSGGAYAARDLLWAVVQTQKLKAEREAEDAKVIAFRDASLAAVYGGGDSNHDAWDALTDTGRAGWRARYNAARKFFEEQS